MDGDPQQPRPPELRISDADRHRLAEFLREAAGEGRLEVDELEERLEATYAAKVYADLVPLVIDLPGASSVVPTTSGLAAPAPAGPGTPSPASYAGLPQPSSSTAVLASQERKGAWVLGPTHTAFSVMGAVVLDLRETVFTVREVIINANTVMGSVDIYVNAHTQVVVEGSGVMGAFEQGRDKVVPEFGPYSPIVRVRGFALMGAVTVTRKPMPGQKRGFLGRASS
ncbi:DUF1707 domain-containing protein [Nocardioides sp. zg-DK7169]|uniref:DUF1707 SHOCT-like domain-containing protein n=1 Tax=Nocardioides sp. zg-DK7169 TaxID=2736600 RepID=UPI001551A3E5|nr:DUF1707 domain-containing protein [Nocardioides sp. zg-DK7169]NPC95784.1 DUF1707 and DUF2154 domain-containing protein [Nocardioides sp. zg-DK7169]